MVAIGRSDGAPVTPALEAARRRLARHAPGVAAGPAAHRAAVAIVLSDPGTDLAVLMIRRAESEGDHWSGHVAFPGGRIDPADAGPREAAERELAEEVGLDASGAAFLGRLDDLRGRTQDIVVSAFVYGVEGTPALRPNHEVAEAFWVPLADLVDPDRHVKRRFTYLGHALDLPALDVLGPGEPVLWGLSYRFLELLMRHLGRAIPSMPWRSDL